MEKENFSKIDDTKGYLTLEAGAKKLDNLQPIKLN